jgi:hypothetical protein
MTGRPKTGNQTAVPAKAGTHLSADRTFELWVPAFAGTAENR